jgi:peptidoglycan/LPS O-acetylase OafA/YrhL
VTIDAPVRAPASPATVSGRRRLDIQGMRAIAVLLVVVFHAKLPVPGGFVGVDVFFVISGFVITAMLMREWATSGTISFGRFYLRRFLRLTPALALLVGVVALASLVLQNPFGAQQATARTGIGAMLLSANYVIGNAAGDYFAATSTTNPLLNTWSLSVEEQFYLVFPALLLLGWVLARRTGRRLLPGIVVLGIGAASFGLSLALSFGSDLGSAITGLFGGPQSFAFYSSLTRAWEFAAGALLALGLSRLPVLTPALARGVGALGAATIAATALLLHETMVFPGWWAVAPVAGTMLLILAGAHHTTGVNAVLATRPFVAIGDTSYSWYLWHWPVIVFAALLFPGQRLVLVVAAVVSLAPALLSYRFLEQPLRRLRPRTRSRSAGLIIVTLGVPLALCSALLTGASAGWGMVPSSSVVGSAGSGPAAGADGAGTGNGGGASDGGMRATDGDVTGGDGGSLRSQHIAVRSGCVNTALRPSQCRFGPDNATGTVLLAGDSQAYALADGVIAAASGLGLDTIVTSHTGCPFLGRESSGAHNYPCRAWQKSIVDYALKTRPAVVAIANLSAGYVNPDWKWRTAATDSGGAASSAKEAVDLWRRGLEPIVRTLRGAGIGVVILGNVPTMHGYQEGTTLLSRAFGSRDFTIPRADADAERRPAFDVEERFAQADPGVVVVDPQPVLCDADACYAAKDGTVRYQDETHLSVDGSLLLADVDRAAITSAAAGSALARR